MYSKFKKYFMWIFLFLILTGTNPANAAKVNLSEWKKFPQKNKYLTSMALISEVAMDTNFKVSVESSEQMKDFAGQLLVAIDVWANNNKKENDEIIVDKAIFHMFKFGWLDENYFNPLPKATPSTSKQKVNVKPKLMSKKAGREWVKNNVHLRLHFPLEDMKYRLGDYQATTIGNIERYYFPRINMTFFVIKSSQEFIGFSESEPSQKK